MKCALGRCVALTFSLLPGVALGQSASAEELYRAGVAEFEKGQYDAACQAFAASYQAEPLLGALFTLATCEMRSGRLATAAERYAEFLALVAALPAEQRAAQEERREVAERERSALVKRLPYLKIVAPEVLQSRAVIKLDGVVLDRARLGVELAVDPGEHVIGVAGADGTANEVRVALLPREHKSVVLSPVGVTMARIETTQMATESPTVEERPIGGTG